MEATVKQDARWRVVTACAGHEFVRGEWRAVPPDMEAEARANPFLDVRPTPTDAGREPVEIIPDQDSYSHVQHDPAIAPDPAEWKTDGPFIERADPPQSPTKPKKGRK